jgi:5-methyltetrahydrofolate--homocysteine methyltransferase
VEALVDPKRRDALKSAVLQKAIANRDAPAVAPPPPAPPKRGGDVPAAPRIPTPPFWGTRVVPSGAIRLDELWPMLDLDELYKLQWGVRAKGAEYEKLVREEFGPKLAELQAEATAKGWLIPKVVYGHFPVHAEGNDLVVLDPANKKAELARLKLPRQHDDRHLCLADWFREEPGSDVATFQVVTVGDQASHLADEAQARGDYTRGLFLHGLAVETAEALAEYWHRKVRAELAVPEGQGKRYSPGYPSWPDLADQKQVWKLLEPDRAIGVTLTEAHQMVPEQSTSAIVLHHPDAIYFIIRGQNLQSL